MSTPSIIDMFNAAIRALGSAAKPRHIRQYIQDTFGESVNILTIAQYRYREGYTNTKNIFTPTRMDWLCILDAYRVKVYHAPLHMTREDVALLQQIDKSSPGILAEMGLEEFIMNHREPGVLP